MKIALQYGSDSDGKTQSVQLPLTDWEKLMNKLKKYEQTLKIKSDLKEAFDQVAELRKSKVKKQTLKDFLMGYNIVPTPKFKKETKRLVKKYPSLKNELRELGTLLLSNPTLGTPLGMTPIKLELL